MLKDVVEVQPTTDYGLRLRFEDGAEGEVDVAVLIQFEGVFASLKDRTEFLKVFVDPELGTICWPNGADLDPDVLYAKVTGEDITVSQPLESQKLHRVPGSEDGFAHLTQHCSRQGKPETLELERNLMKLVVVTQWVRADGSSPT